MTAEELRLELSNIVSSLDDSEIISMWNEIANGDNWIYSNDEYELDTVFDGQKPSDIIRTIFFGDYRYNDNYFCFNGYANLDSFDYVDDKNSPYDEDMLIDYIIENEALGLQEDPTSLF